MNDRGAQSLDIVVRQIDCGTSRKCVFIVISGNVGLPKGLFSPRLAVNNPKILCERPRDFAKQKRFTKARCPDQVRRYLIAYCCCDFRVLRQQAESMQFKPFQQGLLTYLPVCIQGGRPGPIGLLPLVLG